VNFSAVYTHFQCVIGLVSQIIHLNAVPGIRSDLRATPPLALLGRDVIAGDMVGSQYTLDLAYTDFIIGIEGFLQAEEVFVVVTRHITDGYAGIDVSTGIETLGASRQCADDLCRGSAAFEVNGFGTAVGFAAIHQGVLGTAQGIAVVRHPADKVLPTGRLGIYGTAFEVVAEQDTGTIAH